MNRPALFDLIMLLFTFIGSWYLKSYLSIEFQGAFIIVVMSIVASLILKIRHLSFKDIGFIKRGFDKGLFKEVFYISLLIFAVQFIGILITTPLYGSPESGNAVTHQPTTLIGFLLDILVMVWIVTAIGEEFIFRGIVLNRLKVLFRNSNSNLNIALISGIQAIWFGLGHQSQGISGIIITGLIGFALGIYVLKNTKLGLWPVIIAHGLIDTIVLTINFIK